MKTYNFTSNGFWFAPGMVRNYKYARKVKDTFFTKLFEDAYPNLPPEVFDKLAAGDYILSDDGEAIHVTI